MTAMTTNRSNARKPNINLIVGAAAVLVSAFAVALIFGYSGLENARAEAASRRAQARSVRRELAEVGKTYQKLGDEIAAMQRELAKPLVKVGGQPVVVVKTPITKKPPVKKVPEEKVCLDLNVDTKSAFNPNSLASKCK